MIVRPDERVSIARLLTFLMHGELLAQDCAALQANLVPDQRTRRFLRSQARQEGVHALIFQGAIRWLAPRQIGACPLLPALEEYRSRIEAAAARGEWYETILAEQVILEGLGESILARIEEGLVTRAAPLRPVRRILLAQEAAHHAFGERILGRALAAGATSVERLYAVAQGYVELTKDMVTTLAELFESIDEDADLYLQGAMRRLPHWVTGDEQPCGSRHPVCG